jgi:hypothetical protein
LLHLKINETILNEIIFLHIYNHNSPHSSIIIVYLGLFYGPTGVASILLKTYIDPASITLPKTTCFPSNQSHFVQVIKN